MKWVEKFPETSSRQGGRTICWQSCLSGAIAYLSKIVLTPFSPPFSPLFRPDPFSLRPIAVCHNSVVVIIPDVSKIEPYYLLAILNSGTFWRFIRLTTPCRGCARQVLRLSDVRRFPIPWPMTEAQRRLCEAIAGLARQAMRSAEFRTVQDKIDALANVLYKASDRWIIERESAATI